jgi:hypothetical protein
MQRVKISILLKGKTSYAGTSLGNAVIEYWI